MLRLAASLSKVLPAAATPRILSRIATPNFTSHNNFSTDAASNQKDHREHVKVSIPEIKSKHLTPLQQKTPPAAPPEFPFTVVDKPYTVGRAYLLREFNGEKILLSIFKPEHIQSYREEGLELMVVISKENVKSAAFGVAMCRCHGMRVRLMSFIDDTTHKVDSKGKLQSGLQEYLKTRGIEPRYAEYLYEYMVWKFMQQPMLDFIKE